MNKNILFVLLAISIIVALTSLWNREIGTDDAWLAEHAYWLVEDGHVRSELFYGLHDHHKQYLVYHRLLVWHGAAVYKLFGWSANAFKMIILIYFVLFLYVSHRYIDRQNSKQEIINKQVFLILAISMALAVRLSFIYRPDIMAMAFGFFSFAMLHASISNKNKLQAMFAGVFAGAAVLTHLNGMVYVIAGGLVLLMFGNFRLLVSFSLMACIVSMLYFIEFRNWDMFAEYWYQFRNDPALSEKDFSVFGTLLKILSGFKAYFFKGTDASYTLLFMFAFWMQRERIKKDENLKIIFMYFVFIAIALAMISPGSKSVYLVYHAPYAFLLIAALYKDMFELPKAKQRVFVFLFGLFLLTQWGGSLKLLIWQTPDLEQTHYEMTQFLNMPKGARIVAPIPFVFNEIDNYTIQSFYVYRILSSHGKFDLVKDFFKVASENNRQYLILDDEHLQFLQMSPPVKGDVFDNYRYMGSVKGLYGFKHL